MALMFLTILLSLGMLIIAGMTLREVRSFRLASRGVARVRRLTLRLSMAGMTLFLLGSILVGLNYFGLKEPDGIHNLWMAFWGCITLLAGAIMILAIADFRTIGDDTLHDVKPDWEEISRIIAEHQSRKKD